MSTEARYIEGQNDVYSNRTCAPFGMNDAEADAYYAGRRSIMSQRGSSYDARNGGLRVSNG